MHAMGSTETTVILGNRLPERMLVILPGGKSRVGAGERLDTGHICSQNNSEVRYSDRKARMDPLQTNSRSYKEQQSRIGSYGALPYSFHLIFFTTKAPRIRSSTALAAGLGTPNTQGIALEMHYNKRLQKSSIYIFFLERRKHRKDRYIVRARRRSCYWSDWIM